MAELQGADPWKKLTHEVQGLTIKPYYSREDSPADSLRLTTAQGTFRGPRTWYNCPYVAVDDPAKANARALNHLENGADGIFFELHGAVDFNILLKKIEWPLCSLNFLAPHATPAETNALTAYLSTFSGESPGAWYGPAGNSLPANRSFRSLGRILRQSDSPARDVAEIFEALIQSIGEPFSAKCGQAAICVEMGNDFFIEIAKLRAIRQSWQRLLASRKAGDQPLYLHAWSRAWTAEPYAPHGNMIRATTSAMAAILGGCDVLTVDAENNNDDMELRIARNTAILLREEARFSKVADPLAGAYFVDQLSSQLADQIWNNLQASR